jgi:hypothetical protein
MSIAQKIDPMLTQRQALAAAKAAERTARDQFIQVEFAALTARFDEMLRTALGAHTRIALTTATVAITVHCRSFATLNVPAWTAVSTIDSLPKTVTFTPRMDFSQPDQFGTIACAIDFDFRPRRNKDDRIAASLLEKGASLRGTKVGFLTLPMPEGPRDLLVSDLESAFGAWWLRV